jgi:transcription elongation GreA/GreB family factor
MSRAFTKETEEPLPQTSGHRPVNSGRNPVTPVGANMIEGSIASANERLLRAVSNDDITSIKREIVYWEARRASMEVVDYPDDPDRVGFGVTVTIVRGLQDKHLSIVGEDEADPVTGKIAWSSPLAQAIDGAKVGETIELDLPGGQQTVSIEELVAGRPA